MPIAYVLYDHNRAKNVETCKNWLKQFDITLAGRYSEWEYYNSDHALLAGKKAADTVLALQAAKAAANGTTKAAPQQQAQAE
jgi:protoporphyrinogen oxidase